MWRIFSNAAIQQALSAQLQARSLIFEIANEGVPNILAMNQPVLDDAAIVFSHAFYECIAGGKSLEQALTSARLVTRTFHQVGIADSYISNTGI